MKMFIAEFKNNTHLLSDLQRTTIQSYSRNIITYMLRAGKAHQRQGCTPHLPYCFVDLKQKSAKTKCIIIISILEM